MLKIFSFFIAVSLLAFISQIMLLLEKSHLHYHTRKLIEALEDELEEKTSDLQVAYIQLNCLNQSKTTFVGLACHELRTPLTAIYGYSEILRQMLKMPQDEAYAEFVSGIHSGAQRLNMRITDLADVAKIDSHSLQLYPEPCSIGSILAQLQQHFVAELQARHLTLNIEGVNDLPLIKADPEALPKIFRHLLSNAIKYTPDGGIITISGYNCAANVVALRQAGIEVVISDTGIGIDRIEHSFIFTKLYQTGDPTLHSSSKTKFKGGGSGLGLAIVRGLVKAHGGRVWVESQGYDEETLPGSQFHVFLPLA